MDRPTIIRAKLARAVRFGEPDATITRLRQDYYAARVHADLREWLSSDPAPTSEHRKELAALLLGEGVTGATA